MTANPCTCSSSCVSTPSCNLLPAPLTIQGTPEQANQYYERTRAPLLLKHGGYPLVSGMTQGKNLMPIQPALDDWSRLALVRFPSRRALLSLLADPAYGPVEPYKKMALELVLVPVSGEVVLPAMQGRGGALSASPAAGEAGLPGVTSDSAREIDGARGPG